MKIRLAGLNFSLPQQPPYYDMQNACCNPGAAELYIRNEKPELLDKFLIARQQREQRLEQVHSKIHR